MNVHTKWNCLTPILSSLVKDYLFQAYYIKCEHLSGYNVLDWPHTYATFPYIHHAGDSILMLHPHAIVCNHAHECVNGHCSKEIIK